MRTLETPRLLLRPLEDADLDRLTEIWTDPEVARLLITQPKDRDEVKQRLDAMLEYAPLWGMWAIVLRATGELVGRCGFYPFFADSDARAEPELAYLFAREHWGKGLATEASRAALDALFRVHSPKRAVAMTRPEHTASRHVMEKLGMRVDRRVTVRGIEVVLYAIAVSEGAARDTSGARS